MKVGFIGAGKVGSGFGLYLRVKGIKVSGYFDLSSKSSEEASNKVNGEQFKSVDDLLKASDLIFITTPDDIIEAVCEKLTKEPNFTSNLMVAHMSGAADCGLLESASKMGANVFSFHPLQTFANSDEVVDQLKESYFGLEVTTEMKEELEQFIKQVGNPYFILKSEHKANYHMGAVVVSNYLTTLMDYGLSFFEKAGINRSQGFSALQPLIQGALQNISSHGTEEALTGPIARGDKTSITKHLKTFENDGYGEEFYRYMALETLKLAEKEKLKDLNRINELMKILEEEPVRP